MSHIFNIIFYFSFTLQLLWQTLLWIEELMDRHKELQDCEHQLAECLYRTNLQEDALCQQFECLGYKALILTTPETHSYKPSLAHGDRNDEDINRHNPPLMFTRRFFPFQYSDTSS